MIYICYIKYGGNAKTYVLAARHDELDVGDDDDTSSAGRGHVRESREWVYCCC
jgi:hypothetical protein